MRNADSVPKATDPIMLYRTADELRNLESVINDSRSKVQAMPGGKEAHKKGLEMLNQVASGSQMSSCLKYIDVSHSMMTSLQ